MKFQKINPHSIKQKRPKLSFDKIVWTVLVTPLTRLYPYPSIQ